MKIFLIKKKRVSCNTLRNKILTYLPIIGDSIKTTNEATANIKPTIRSLALFFLA